MNGEGFERNMGQVHDGRGGARPDVQFIHAASDRSVLLRNTGFSYQFNAITSRGQHADEGSYVLDYHRIDIDFVGGRSNPEMVTSQSLHNNRYVQANGRTYLAEQVLEVMYKGVYEGVDIRFTANGDLFKYDIICRDAEALARVRFRYSGSGEQPAVTAAGALRFGTRFGVVEEHIPESQLCMGTQWYTVDVRPVLLGGDEVTFVLQQEWPAGHHLIIDPLPHRLWATYLGGEGYDVITRVEVDAMGGILVCGYTDSANNIATSGSHQGTLLGFQNCFLMAFAPGGQKLYGTYFGGELADRCFGLVLEGATGHVYISGSTFSPGIATPGAHQSVLASLDDGLLLKFDAQGSLLWATYYGGEEHDLIADLVLDGQGDLLMTGHTRSMTGIATDLTVLPGNENAFVARFSAAGALLWGTYFGGSFDEGWAIGVDAGDNVLVAGVTSSFLGIGTPGAHQEVIGGGLDAFLAKYAPNGELLWSTYYGGTGNDIANALLISADGSVVIAGDTESPMSIATPGAFQEQPGSIDDGFLARFASDGSLLWGTYIGGEAVEYIKGMTEALDGGILLCGQSQSMAGVTSSNAFQAVPAGEYDALLMRYSADGAFQWGTYLGGALVDQATDLALDPITGHVLVAGMTRSIGGLASPGAQDPLPLGGLFDGFLARFCVPPMPVITALDGVVLCGDGVLQFMLDEDYPSIQWNTGGTEQFLDLLLPGNGIFPIHAQVVDQTGCPGYSDTLSVVATDSFDPEIQILMDPEGPVCLGASITLVLDPSFVDQLWWDGSNGTQVLVTPEDTVMRWLQVTVFNEAGCSATDSVLVGVQDCTGIEGIAADGVFRVHPNPSNGQLCIKWPLMHGALLRLTVLSLDGRTVLEMPVVEGRSVELELPQGVYLMRALGGGRSEEQRLVLVR